MLVHFSLLLSLCDLSIFGFMAGRAVLWFWNLLLLYYRLANFSLKPAAQIGTWPGGYGHGQLVGLHSLFREGLLMDLRDMLVWLFWNIGYLLGKVGFFFLVSIVCDRACGCRSVPSFVAAGLLYRLLTN